MIEFLFYDFPCCAAILAAFNRSSFPVLAMFRSSYLSSVATSTLGRDYGPSPSISAAFSAHASRASARLLVSYARLPASATSSRDLAAFCSAASLAISA
jgi:hypothetical protein